MRIEMYASVRMQNKGALFKELMESMHTFFFPNCFTSKKHLLVVSKET